MNRGANRASNARLDISDRDFWERQRTAFFDVRVCHHNADSYRDLSLHEKSRLMEVEQGTFTPLDFTTTDGMAELFPETYSFPSDTQASQQARICPLKR